MNLCSFKCAWPSCWLSSPCSLELSCTVRACAAPYVSHMYDHEEVARTRRVAYSKAVFFTHPCHSISRGTK